MAILIDMVYKLPYEIPNPVLVNDVVIKHDTFKVFFKDRLLSKKSRFEYHCTSCSKVAITTRGNQMKRKYPWLCDSCTRTVDWATYTRQEKQERQKKTTAHLRSSEMREYHRNRMTDQWADSDSWFRTKFVPPMTNSSSRKKLSQTIKQKLCNDETFRAEFHERMKNNARGTLIKFREPNGKSITLRSTYELRVASWLNKKLYNWLYEPNAFYLEELDKTYTPDFYLIDLNIWIEVKGFWQSEESKLKWESFRKDHKTVLLHNQDIVDLESGGSLEDKVN